MDIKGKCVLTGVKPTGHLHIGNYVGAIKPAIQLGNETLDNGGQFLMFLADLVVMSRCNPRKPHPSMHFIAEFLLLNSLSISGCFHLIMY